MLIYHRVGKHGSTIVKFSKRKDIARIFSNKKRLKEIDTNSLNIPENTRIYINESLCSSYRNIWSKCKALWKDEKIANFWTSNGNVRIKINAVGNYESITHMSDLEERFPEYNFQN